jgi:hypothetical protein
VAGGGANGSGGENDYVANSADGISEKADGEYGFRWWAHKGSNLGPAD